MKRVLSLGAGVQSSALLLMSCKGVLPKLDACVFADTQYEPKAVYEHLEWLKTQAADAGIPLHVVTVGNIREDALEFRQNRRSADGKRYAAIPLFVANPDGSQGRLTRQCTKEYKIQPVELFIKRELLGLKPRQRASKTPVVEQWMGISADEAQRAKAPGQMKSVKVKGNPVLFGESADVKRKVWKPVLWKTHTFPLLNTTIFPNRSSKQVPFFAKDMTREHCIAWLAQNYPGRKFPRSACLCCPFRSNKEWREMRDESPEDFADAVDFDQSARLRDEAGLTDERKQKIRQPLVGTVYIHRQMVPLQMADLSDDERSSNNGCGTLFEEACEGMCGV